MLYSAHQSIPRCLERFGASTYNGKSFDESGAQPSDLSDAQRKFLTEDNVRHVLVTRVQSPEVAARWNNNVPASFSGGHRSRYLTVVDNPDEADFAIVFMTSPISGTGYDKSDREKGGNGYMPISLQYNDYTATYARNPSLAGGRSV